MALYQQSFSVFSTYVEVIPMRQTAPFKDLGFLHVCGGDPHRDWAFWLRDMFSPRMWR